MSEKEIASVTLSDDYYPCIPPSYSVNVRYVDGSGIEKSMSPVDIFKKYDAYLSVKESNRIKNALREYRSHFRLDFEVPPNQKEVHSFDPFSPYEPEELFFYGFWSTEPAKETQTNDIGNQNSYQS